VPAVATVKGTLVFRMSSAFAGWRQSVDLGRSGVLHGARSHDNQRVAPMTTGVLWKNEEGNVVGVRQAHALVVADA